MLSQAAFDTVKAKLGSLIPEAKAIKDAQKYFDMWYKYWVKANTVSEAEALPDNQPAELKEDGQQAEGMLPAIEDNKNVSKNIDIKDEVKLEDEVKVESLKHAMEKAAPQSSDAGGADNQPQEGEQQSE